MRFDATRASKGAVLSCKVVATAYSVDENCIHFSPRHLMSNMDDKAAFYSKYQGGGSGEGTNNDADEQVIVKKSAIQKGRDTHNKNDNSKAFIGVKTCMTNLECGSGHLEFIRSDSGTWPS